MKRISFLFLAVALWGCGSDTNPDGDGNVGTNNSGDGGETFGSAMLNPSIADDSAWSVTVEIGSKTFTGQTGEAIEVEIDSDGDTAVVEFGNETGCDGQAIQGNQMALSQTVDLTDGVTVDVTASPFPYYEWDGSLACTAWDDYGWSYDYDPNDVTDGNVTCVDHRGRLEVGGDTIDFSTNEVITGQGGTITDLNVDSDGLSLTYIGDGGTTYVDCIVVD